MIASILLHNVITRTGDRVLGRIDILHWSILCNMFSSLISWNRWNEMTKWVNFLIIRDHYNAQCCWFCSFRLLMMTYQVKSTVDSFDRMLWLFMMNIEFYRYTFSTLLNFLFPSLSLWSVFAWFHCQLSRARNSQVHTETDEQRVTLQLISTPSDFWI